METCTELRMAGLAHMLSICYEEELLSEVLSRKDSEAPSLAQREKKREEISMALTSQKVNC